MKLKISPATNRRSQQCQLFAKLALESIDSGLELVDSYSDAEIIFITDLHHRNLYADILAKREHVDNYHKLICYYEHEFPPDDIPGIYTCGSIESAATRGASFFFWLQGHPLDLGKREQNDRCYLFSFMGRKCNSLREKILELNVNDAKFQYILKDTTYSYPVFSQNKDADLDQIERQRYEYFDVLSKTKFALAPKGTGLSSIRQYEAMAFGAVPVVLSDKLKQPYEIDWGSCSVFIPESEINAIPEILLELESDFPSMSAAALSSYEKLMSPVCYWRYLSKAIIDIYENDMDRRSSLGVLRRKVAYRAIHRTIYRRRQELRHLGARFFGK